MPFSTLLRRGRKSEANIRRHSLLIDPSEGHSEFLPPVALSLSTDSLSGHLLGAVQASSVGHDKRATMSPAPRHRDDRLAPPASHEHDRARPGLVRNRHVSDSQLSTRAGKRALANGSTYEVSDLRTPSIVTTAPAPEVTEMNQTMRPRLRILGQPNQAKQRQTNRSSPVRQDQSPGEEVSPWPEPPVHTEIAPELLLSGGLSRSSAHHAGAPPAYGDETGSLLALPLTRLSESSRSDGSSSERIAYATTTTTHTVSTTTTFFRLQRRNKPRPSLFPLPPKVVPSDSDAASRAGENGVGSLLASASVTALGTSSSNAIREESQLRRRQSVKSARSAVSSPSAAPASRLSSRGRSSTMGSLGDEPRLSTPPAPTGRASTSTTGRSSLASFFTLPQRLRPSSDTPFPRHGSSVPSSRNTSKPNSFSLARESVVVPEREAEETPAKYLARLQEAVNRGAVAGILSRSDDGFSQAVLRSYMRSFAFFEYPMDMAIRKLLMQVELPKETQQIDRVLQKFADRYHECNPGIFTTPDQAYFIAFSLLILHTDVFNKNNKHKMQKQDYIKNTRGEGVSEDILECFYDNICYTPFIHVEDDLDISGERGASRKSRKSLFPRAATDVPKRGSKEPVDPYTLIIDQRLDFLRPNLKDVMNDQDPYRYLGTAKSLDIRNLQRTFFKSGILQIVSARSRPDAFMSPMTISNPEDAHPGVVDIKVTKVGIISRKDSKKKKARSPWQEWGAILTGSQLYFFRNTTWVRNLVHQYDQHQKYGPTGTPVVFKPPLETFKPDALMSTDDAVALLDSSYKKHKHAFLFVRHGGFEETFLAENESEMNDWLAKLNYAATFRTAGVRMRAMVASGLDLQRSKSGRKVENSTRSVHQGEMHLSSKNESQLTHQILVARRQIMRQKIREANEKLLAAHAQLELQLRNSRHLQLLAPIQAKTREQIILAAGGMAAKVKWVRMELWRLKCHRDILMLDLEDEQSSTVDTDSLGLANHDDAGVIPSVSDGPRARKGSYASRSIVPSSPQYSTRSPRIPSRPSSKDHEIGKDDMARASADPLRMPGQYKVQGSTELSNLTSSPQSSINDSSNTAPGGSRVGSFNGLQSTIDPLVALGQGGSTGIVRLATRQSSVDEAEAEVLKEAGLLQMEGSPPEPRLQDVALPEENNELTSHTISEGEGHDKSKVRRGLHRTLRDNHVVSHHRSRKGRDSSSSAAMTEDGSSTMEKEGLARSTGSFTLHGKKASVITFGSEWQNIPPEERLKLRKHAHAEDSKFQPSPVLEDDAIRSGLALLHAGQASARSLSTTSTGTARSTAVGEDALPAAWSQHNNNLSDIGLAISAAAGLPGTMTAVPSRVDETASVRQSYSSTNRASAAVTSDEEYQSASEDVRENDAPRWSGPGLTGIQ